MWIYLACSQGVKGLHWVHIICIETPQPLGRGGDKQSASLADCNDILLTCNEGEDTQWTEEIE